MQNDAYENGNSRVVVVVVAAVAVMGDGWRARHGLGVDGLKV